MQLAIQIVTIGKSAAALFPKLEQYTHRTQFVAVDLDPAVLDVAREFGAANILLQLATSGPPTAEAMQRAVEERASELRALSTSITHTWLVTNLAEPIATATAATVAGLCREAGSEVHAIVLVPHAVLSRKTAQRAGIALNQLTACTDSITMPQPSGRTEDPTVAQYLDHLEFLQVQKVRAVLDECDALLSAQAWQAHSY